MGRTENRTLWSLIGVLALISGQALAKVVHVDAGAAPGGDGTSWATAFRHLQDGLAQAVNGDEVWLAAGTYFPDDGVGLVEGDRAATFSVAEGVTIFGGFAGYESASSESDPAVHISTLSGEISGNSEERSLHVLTALGSCTLDGLIVTRGNANRTLSPDDGGGGIRAIGTSGTLLELRRCGLIGNNARGWGGAAHCELNCALTAVDCLFSNNTASAGGAAHFSNGSLVTLTGCVFSDNFASFGGAVVATTLNASECTFSRNSSDGYGGAVVGDRACVTSDCVFSDNTARYRGGALYLDAGDGAILADTTFSGNFAEEGGGAVFAVSGSKLSVTDCNFSDNSAPNEDAIRRGGAIWCQFPWSVDLKGCMFSGNSAYEGGAVAVERGEEPLFATDCTFSGNSAFQGGAVATDAGAAFVATDCIFSQNSAEYVAGAAWMGGSFTATNCAFTENSARYGYGGGLVMYRDLGAFAALSCTFTGNVADGDGGAIFLWSDIDFIAINCVFENNSSLGSGGAISALHHPTFSVANSTFVGNYGRNGGGAVDIGSTRSVFENCNFYGNRVQPGEVGRALDVEGDVDLLNNVIWDDEGGGGLVSVSGIIRNHEGHTSNPELRAKNLVSGGFASFTIGPIATVDLGDTTVTIPSGDPLFVDAANPGGADGEWGTADDGLRLRTGSAAIDQGLGIYLPADDFDLDGDGNATEPLPVDAAGYLRVQGAAVDLGAYEAGPGYAEWAAGHGLTGDDLPMSAAPAKDGISNLVKFGLGLNPWGSSPPPTDGSSRGLPSLIRQEDGTFRFVAVVDTSSADLSFAVEETETFESWVERSSGITRTPLGEGLLRLEIESPVGGANFFRLEVETD